MQDGEEVTIDAETRQIVLDLTAEEIARRLSTWQQHASRYTRSVPAKYAKTVATASEGAVTDTNL